MRYKRRRGTKDDASAKPTELAGHVRNESASAVFIMKYDSLSSESAFAHRMTQP